MRCPYPNCGYAKTYVVKTTLPVDKVVETVKERRRICNGCKQPFLTYEVNAAEFKRLCSLIESEGPTRTPLLTRTKKIGMPTISPTIQQMKGKHGHRQSAPRSAD